MKLTSFKVFHAILLATTFLATPTYASITWGTTLFENNTSTNTSYSRANAVTYAEQWADQGKTSTTYNGYYNYGAAGGGGDCTNFVSQVLHNGGGLPFAGTKGNNSFDSDWYYYGPNIPDRTSSWTGASQFRQYWGLVNNVGGKHGYAMRRYDIQVAIDHFDELYADLWPGDIIQYVDSGGTTTHTQVIHAYSNPNLSVAQHSDSTGTWAKNLDLKNQLIARKSYGTVWITTLKVKYAAN